MKEKAKKRDLNFSKTLKMIDRSWVSPNSLLVIKDENYGMAESWKYLIYHTQFDAAKSLIIANSNQHPVGHKVYRDEDTKEITYSSQIVEKAYFLRYACILLQACGDKLANLIRLALDIQNWKNEKKKDEEGNLIEEKAREDNTYLNVLRAHLKITNNTSNLYKWIKEYSKDKSVERINEIANAIKHRWPKYYQGEGLSPSKKPIKDIRDPSGKITGKDFSIGSSFVGIDIAEDIKQAKRANNLFVQLANRIVAELNFEGFYQRDEEGKRYLDISKAVKRTEKKDS
ncbi:MAG: hypothetical protein A3G93_00995 [Nitrospinae bacterium RIFCSPLOWO2_12_FULL_45_22]|nr:MAG: hypothetical protein A3G93_00995 [Nitrospinae bacterium RIFCSPLOWO2_12_FULL_45_22]